MLLKVLSNSILTPEIKDALKNVEKGLLDLTQTGNKNVSLAAKQTLSAGGKRLRPALIFICGGIDNVEKLMPAAVAVEAIHMASLIHDDLIDKTKTRRGMPTIYSTFGDVFAVRSGDFVFAKAFAKLAESGSAEAVSILAKSAIDLTIGEVLQQKTAFVPNQTETLYLSKIKLKTASLFEACCLIAGILSGKNEKEIEAAAMYGINLGYAFQIYDDVLDITGDPKEMGKPAGSDVADGIVTLPYLYATDELKSRKELDEILEKKSNSPEELSRAIDIIKSTNAIEKAKERAKDYIKYAIACTEKLDKTAAQSLKNIASFVVDRYH